jgi:isopentenyl diphosphate isomerase/L-lactate dehydrogenase-like FMN-dependent dehydrogenase
MWSDEMTITEPRTATRFSTLDEIREAALAKLDPAVRDFLEGGAGDETTLGRNRSVFGHWALQPRVMSGLESPSLSTSFLGVDLGLPILTAPFGADGLFDPEGQVAVARANALMGTASIAPEAGSHSIEEIAKAAPAAAAFGQLHPTGPRRTSCACSSASRTLATEASALPVTVRLEDGASAICAAVSSLPSTSSAATIRPAPRRASTRSSAIRSTTPRRCGRGTSSAT